MKFFYMEYIYIYIHKVDTQNRTENINNTMSNRLFFGMHNGLLTNRFPNKNVLKFNGSSRRTGKNTNILQVTFKWTVIIIFPQTFMFEKGLPIPFLTEI